ncbi:hypothetical protein NDU88_002132 [Pleurodeles waltl]|uniref:Uncharacterized protein n=1 Tax=Pleurodeles waltl TaxID=8319 RepID=A0AAV7NCS5_PLEWA|nr:hypothetical protein NDU88_002132 [Pleurodeles waltl]
MDRLTWPAGSLGSMGPPTPRTVGLLCRHTPQAAERASGCRCRGLLSGVAAECGLLHRRGQERPYHCRAPLLTAARRPNSSTGIPPSPAGPKRVTGAGLTQPTSAADSATAQTKAPLPPPLQRVLTQVALR